MIFDIILSLESLYQVWPYRSLFRNSTGVAEKGRQRPIKLFNSLADNSIDLSDSDERSFCQIINLSQDKFLSSLLLLYYWHSAHP